MTRHGILELADVERERHLAASRKTKTRILDEFVLATHMHRKAAIRLLNRKRRKTVKKRRGRPGYYDLETMSVLKIAWEASDRLCSKRLHPFLSEMVEVLVKKREVMISEQGKGKN